MRGPTSFEDLRTVDGVLESNFQSACVARHLLSNDQVWKNTLQEAANFKMPRQLRYLFAYMIGFNSVTNPLELWNFFVNAFIEDYRRRNFHVEEAKLRALSDVARILRNLGEYTMSKCSSKIYRIVAIFLKS